MKSFLKILALLILVAVPVIGAASLGFVFPGCSGAHPAPAPTPALQAATLAQLQSDLATAATRPNTTIRFTADIESPDTLNVQGNGTVIDLNGHAFSYAGHFDGTRGGYGLVVGPTLGDAVPYVKGAKNVIYCCPAGSVGPLEVKAGGNIDPASFHEPAPVRYAGGILLDTFILQHPIDIPAQNITIKNGHLVAKDPQAISPLNIAWAKGVTVQNVTFDYPGTLIDNAGTGAQESENVTFTGCDFGGHHCAFNSTWQATVTGCRNGDVTFEERCVGMTVAKSNLVHVRVNDATCLDATFTGNTFTDPNDNFGCIALPEMGGTSVISGNTLAGCGEIWISTLGTGATLSVTGNTGKYFAKYGGAGGITESGNSWQGKSIMAISTITSELFNSQAVYNAATPGGLGTVATGTLNRAVRGAATAGRGFGGGTYTDFTSWYNMPGAPTTTVATGFAYFWVKFSAWGSNTTAIYKNSDDQVHDPTAGGTALFLVVSPTGMLIGQTNQGNVNLLQLSLDTWYKITNAWHGSMFHNVYVDMAIGTFTIRNTLDTNLIAFGQNYANYIGLCNVASSGHVNVTFSGFYVFNNPSSDALADPAGLVAPPGTALDFYVRNDAVGGGNGSANNSAAALTVAELAVNCALCAIGLVTTGLWQNNGFAISPQSYTAEQLASMVENDSLTWHGDRIFVGTNLNFTNSSDTLVHVGHTYVCASMDSADGTKYTLNAFKPVTGWALYNAGTYPNVWTAPVTTAYHTEALFEDGNCLNHPNCSGAITGTHATMNGTDYVSVAAAVDAVPGTFWNNGTNWFLHTLDGLAPSTHSEQSTTAFGGALASINGYVKNLTFDGFCQIDPDGTISGTGDYGVLLTDQTLSAMRNVSILHFGKHGTGTLNTSPGTSNGRLVFVLTNIEKGPPCLGNPTNKFWGGIGATTNWVGYGESNSSSGSEYALLNCSAQTTDCVIGTTGGTINPFTNTLYFHGATNTASIWSKVSVIGSNMAGAGAQIAGLIASSSVIGSIIGGDLDIMNAVVSESQIGGSLKFRGGTNRLSNNLMTGLNANIGGTIATGNSVIIISHLTSDLSQASTNNASDGDSLINIFGNCTLSLTDSVVVLPAGGHTFGIYKSAVAGSITTRNNAYVLGTGKVAMSYNDGNTTSDRTLAQAQADGLESDSILVATRGALQWS